MVRPDAFMGICLHSEVRPLVIAAAMTGWASLVTGLSPKPVTSQTPYIQTNNADSDGLTGFSGKNLRNAHAREATLPPAQISSKRFRSIFGIMYFCNIYILMVSRAVCAAWQMIGAGWNVVQTRAIEPAQIAECSRHYVKHPYSMRRKHRNVPDISKIEYGFCAPFISRYYQATDKAKKNVLKEFVVAMRKRMWGWPPSLYPIW